MQNTERADVIIALIIPTSSHGERTSTLRLSVATRKDKWKNMTDVDRTAVDRKLHKAYADAALSETTCRDWFRRFKDGDFDVGGLPREERSKTFEDVELKALLDEDPCQTQQELSLTLEVTSEAITKRALVIT
ncbi:hypothetical protein Trydic_g21186 [Trypoxylus dichotomus]